MLKKILLGLAVILAAIQFIPVDRSVPDYAVEQDFFATVDVPQQMAVQIKNACYDCHSYESKYPWYADLAPVSFWIQGHINGGRQHLNFSTWASLSNDKKKHKLEECFEEIQEGSMPMQSYVNMHPEAALTQQEQEALAMWFSRLAKSISAH